MQNGVYEPPVEARTEIKNGDREDNFLVGDQGTRTKDIMNGYRGNDILDGGQEDDTLSGGSGEDQLWGGADDDKLFGGSGDDLVVGGSGNDRLHGGRGADTFLFSGREGEGRDKILDFDPAEDKLAFHRVNNVSELDLVETSKGVEITDPNGNVIELKGITLAELDESNFEFLVSDGDPVDPDPDPIPTAEPDTVRTEIRYGTGGDDIIVQDSGVQRSGSEDVFYGGAGDDTLDGDGLRDMLFGGDGQDMLFGGADHDKLFGGNGSDVLIGGGDADHLTGGAGADRFVSGANSDGLHDTIKDFTSGVDQIVFFGASAEDLSLTDTDKGVLVEIGDVKKFMVLGAAVAELDVADNFVFADSSVELEDLFMPEDPLPELT